MGVVELVLLKIGDLLRFCAAALVIAFVVVAIIIGGGDSDPAGTSGAGVTGSSCGSEESPVGIV